MAIQDLKILPPVGKVKISIESRTGHARIQQAKLRAPVFSSMNGMLLLGFPLQMKNLFLGRCFLSKRSSPLQKWANSQKKRSRLEKKQTGPAPYSSFFPSIPSHIVQPEYVHQSVVGSSLFCLISGNSLLIAIEWIRDRQERERSRSLLSSWWGFRNDETNVFSCKEDSLICRELRSSRSSLSLSF